MKITDFIDDVQHVGIPTTDLSKSIAFWESLGFTKRGQFKNGDGQVAFMTLNHLTIETWTADETPMKPGAINHISPNTSNADEAFIAAKDAGFTMIDHEVQSLPFWDHGIKYFNIQGPNGEIVEFCQIVTA
ncbi:VOC family protein [Furfurilactobacillus milii]|uniref:VOC family protein n=1 Tax=Furfurilactobacillus rossiae TaxID=231049 RepID=A0A7C9IV49_9LACO|nr:VOC family protein [Furfurilactobacillus milii]MYV06336.1 VOC family protein [Furfurilactobacillus milii]